MMKTAAFQLASGVTILAEVVDEGDKFTMVRWPLELEIGADPDGYATYKFYRFMPFDTNNTTLLNNSTIQCMSGLAEDFHNYYEKKVSFFIEAQAKYQELLAKRREEAEQVKEKRIEGIEDLMNLLSEINNKKKFH